MPTESELNRELSERLKRRNAVVLPMVASEMSVPGVPDRYVHHTYWCGWIECKAWDGKLSERQRDMIRELNKRKEKTAIVVRYEATATIADIGWLHVEDHDGHELFVCQVNDLLKELYRWTESP